MDIHDDSCYRLQSSTLAEDLVLLILAMVFIQVIIGIGRLIYDRYFNKGLD